MTPAVGTKGDTMKTLPISDRKARLWLVVTIFGTLLLMVCIGATIATARFRLTHIVDKQLLIQ